MRCHWLSRIRHRLLGWHRCPAGPSDRLDPGPWPWAPVFSHYPFLACLSEHDQARLADLGHRFLREKRLAGAHELQIDPFMAASIAAQACLPALELGLTIYRGWRGIVVYPGAFRTRVQIIDEAGVMHEGDDERIGEAWPGGPVILSWADALHHEPGRNVVIHEFAHKIAMASGEADPWPAAPPGLAPEDWVVILGRAQRRLDSADRCGRPLPFDAYALENEAEFFAVMSEAFFTRPAVLARHLPDLYQALARFYRQDPVSRMAGTGG